MPVSYVTPPSIPVGIRVGTIGTTHVVGPDGKQIVFINPETGQQQALYAITIPLTSQFIQSIPPGAYSGLQDTLAALQRAGYTTVRMVYDPPNAGLVGRDAQGAGMRINSPSTIPPGAQLPFQLNPNSTITIKTVSQKEWNDFLVSDLANQWLKPPMPGDEAGYLSNTNAARNRFGIILNDDPRIISAPLNYDIDTLRVPLSIITSADAAGIESQPGRYPTIELVKDATGGWVLPKMNLGELIRPISSMTGPITPLDIGVAVLGGPVGRAVTGIGLLARWARNARRWLNPLALGAGVASALNNPSGSGGLGFWNIIDCRSDLGPVASAGYVDTGPNCNSFESMNWPDNPGHTHTYGAYHPVDRPVYYESVFIEATGAYWARREAGWFGPGPVRPFPAKKGMRRPIQVPTLNPDVYPDVIVPGMGGLPARTIPWMLMPFKNKESVFSSQGSNGGYGVPMEPPPIYTYPVPGEGQPDKRRTKSAKLRTSRGALVVRIFNEVSEVCDAVGALYKALPRARQVFVPGMQLPGGDPSRFRVSATCAQQAEAVYRYFNEIDWNTAIINLLKENATDYFYGGLGRITRKANKKIGRAESSIIVSRIGLPQLNLH